MPIEIEKKYRLSGEQAVGLIERIVAEGGEFLYERHEENLLYRGGVLDERNAVLRVRKTDAPAFLTYKENAGFEGGVKKRVEIETEIGDARACEEIIQKVGFRLSLVYEKRRKAWRLAGCEVVLDELPFGCFMEIEGSTEDILAAEKLLRVEDVAIESSTYPGLTMKHGKDVGGVMEARF